MFLGRGPDMERLDRVTVAAADGGGEALLIVGAPGIGKTALLDVAARRAARRRVRVVRARAAEGSLDLPNALSDDLLAALGASPEQPDDGPVRPVVALHEALRAAARDGPLLLLLDDVHNADDASLEAIAVALGRRVGESMSAVLTTRPEGAGLARLAAWPRLDLLPLSPEASAAVLRSVLGGDADARVLAALGRALQGVPLALREAPLLLTPEQLAGRAPLPDPLPVAPALMAAWNRVLDRQPEPTRRALLDLAVAGPRPDLLAALGDRPAADASWTPGDLDAAAAAGLVSTAALPPSFVHPLVRDVVLRGAPAAVLRARHAVAAEQAGRLSLPPAVVVHHLVRSVVMADAAVADRVAAEAIRAERLGHLDAACRAWEAAARLSVDPAERADRALRGVRLVARYDLGVVGAGGLLDMLAGVELDAESAAWVSWLRAVQRADVDPMAALLAEWTAIEEHRSDAPDLLPVLLWEAAMSAWTVGRPDLGLRAARELAALEPAATAGPSRVSPPWTGVAMTAAALIQAGRVAEGARLRERALALAAAVDPAQLELGMLLDAVFLDDLLLDESSDGARRLAVAEDRLRNAPEPLACLWGIEAWRARATGDWSAARSLLARARPLADEAGAGGAVRGMAALATELAAASADLAEVDAEAARLRDLADRWGDRRRRATHDRAVGLRALLDGRLDDAVGALLAAADAHFLGRGLRDGVIPARVDLVEAFVRQGDRAEAVAWHDRVHPILTDLGTPAADGLAHRCDALLAEAPSDADTAYHAALAAHTRSAERFEHARTVLLFGEHLRRTGRRREARLALADAVSRFELLGARPWRDRAFDELRACGADVGARRSAAGRSASSPRGSAAARLTPQERAVALAVSAGRSNQEAAAFLSLSPRTVEHHLGSCYRKLGVRGRVALARALQADES